MSTRPTFSARSANCFVRPGPARLGQPGRASPVFLNSARARPGPTCIRPGSVDISIIQRTSTMWTLVTFLVGCSTLALNRTLLFAMYLPSARFEVGSSGCVLIPIRVFETPHCLQVESGCSAGGCHMDRGSLWCGPYQIKEPYWIDCGQPGGGMRRFFLFTIHTIYSYYSAISNLSADRKKCANDYACEL